MKVMFIMPKMGVGGIEHVWLKILDGLKKNNIECILAVAKNEGILLEEAKKITPVRIFSPHSVIGFIPGLIRLLKNEKPTHIITAFEDVGLLSWISLSLSKSNAIWIHSVHNTHSKEGMPLRLKDKLRFIMENFFARHYYNKVDKIISVSKGITNEIISDYKISPIKIETIYNPVIPSNMLKTDSIKLIVKPKNYKIISLGRLHYQKGFDILIEAAMSFQGEWTLEIWGDGPEYSNLQKKITELKLDHKVFLKGYTPTPLKIIAMADIFILSSRFEGLGNVLIEAMACQCQLIATNCKHGPSEILEDGKYGQLIPSEDPAELANAVNNVIIKGFQIKNESLINQAKKFTIEKSVNEWVSIIKSIPKK